MLKFCDSWMDIRQNISGAMIISQKKNCDVTKY